MTYYSAVILRDFGHLSSPNLTPSPVSSLTATPYGQFKLIRAIFQRCVIKAARLEAGHASGGIRKETSLEACRGARVQFAKIAREISRGRATVSAALTWNCAFVKWPPLTAKTRDAATSFNGSAAKTFAIYWSRTQFVRQANSWLSGYEFNDTLD